MRKDRSEGDCTRWGMVVAIGLATTLWVYVDARSARAGESDSSAFSATAESWRRITATTDGRSWRFRMRTIPVDHGVAQSLAQTLENIGRTSVETELTRRLADLVVRAEQVAPSTLSFDWMVELATLGSRTLETKEPRATFHRWPLRGPGRHPPIQRILDDGIDLQFIPLNMDPPTGAVLWRDRQPVAPLNLRFAVSGIEWSLDELVKDEQRQAESARGRTLFRTRGGGTMTASLSRRDDASALPLFGLFREQGENGVYESISVVAYETYEGLPFPSLAATLTGFTGKARELTVTETLALDVLPANTRNLRMAVPPDGGVSDRGPPFMYYSCHRRTEWPNWLLDLVVLAGPVSESRERHTEDRVPNSGGPWIWVWAPAVLLGAIWLGRWRWRTKK